MAAFGPERVIVLVRDGFISCFEISFVLSFALPFDTIVFLVRKIIRIVGFVGGMRLPSALNMIAVHGRGRKRAEMRTDR